MWSGLKSCFHATTSIKLMFFFFTSTCALNKCTKEKLYCSQIELTSILTFCVTSTADKWSSPSTTGQRPPPCAYFSFTAINDHKAVLFGGFHVKLGYGTVSNDCYLINFESMVCPAIYYASLQTHIPVQ